MFPDRFPVLTDITSFISDGDYFFVKSDFSVLIRLNYVQIHRHILNVSNINHDNSLKDEITFNSVFVLFFANKSLLRQYI